jgi:hypothetical protein
MLTNPVIESMLNRTYDDYSWTEHVSRKWGQWLSEPKELLDQLEKCGFRVETKE